MDTITLTTRQGLLARFTEVRETTERICAPLQKEDAVVQPITDVSPPKWHMAHTTWFFEHFILCRFKKGYKPFHDRYNYLFNSYYESVGERWQRVQRGLLTRPTVEEILDYRYHINAMMEAFYPDVEEHDRKEFEKLLEIGIQHEQQHQELLITDIKYILGTNPLFPHYLAAQPDTHSQDHLIVAKSTFTEIDAGNYIIGYQGDGFHWDNEKPVHTVFLQGYALQNELVTNAQYLEFMMDGGYEDFRHWLQEGFALVKTEEWRAPLYWYFIEGEWYYYTLHGLEKVNPLAPVTHISFYEADAYATWAGKRLPTEFEWEAAAKTLNLNKAHYNFMDNWNLQPIQSPFSNNQILGDVWEWTYSSYHPYPGYTREEGALGEYNGKFMINQMVLRGGSCATPQSHIRPEYRNFFHPDKKWQFSGIRLAEKL